MSKKSKDKKNHIIPKFFKVQIGYWLGIISAVITILSTIFKAFFEIPLWLCIVWLLIVGISIIIMLGVFFINLNLHLKSIKTKKILKNDNLIKIYNRIKKGCSEIHMLSHDMRDYICKNYINNEYNEEICRNICNQIKNIFNIVWKDSEISVSIKSIIIEDNKNDDFKQWKIQTIARSSDSNHNRDILDNKISSIEKNSEFLIIVSPNYIDSVFSCMDLTMINDEFLKKYKIQYSNSIENFTDFYKSIIVAPIRIKSKYVNPTLHDKNIGDYHLVGFLCIETKEIFSEKKEIFEAGIELTKTFADMLYKLLENNIVFNEKEKGRIKNG